MREMLNTYDANNLLIGRMGGVYTMMGYLEFGLFEDWIYDVKNRPITRKENYTANKTLTDYYYDSYGKLFFAEKRVLYKPNLATSKTDTVRNDSMFVYTYQNFGFNNGVKDNTSLAANYTLFNNYPNPFNPSTQIRFSLPRKSDVKLTVYNVLGEEIITLVNGELTAGEHETVFNAKNLSSGVYFYKLVTQEGAITRKMLLAK
jgi:hypothetical protein